MTASTRVLELALERMLGDIERSGAVRVSFRPLVFRTSPRRKRRDRSCAGTPEVSGTVYEKNGANPGSAQRNLRPRRIEVVVRENGVKTYLCV